MWQAGFSSIQSGGSGTGGALSLLIIRACNVFKECGPMITSILRKCLQFNFANTYPHIYSF
jgi:hypothetical protein